MCEYLTIPEEQFTINEEYWIKLHNKNCDFPLNLENPVWLSDKMTYCNIYYNYNKDLFYKNTAKNEIQKILKTNKYCIPTYQICDTIEEISLESLIGKSFVIKPSNKASSHGVIIQKRALKRKDIPELEQQLKENKYLNNCKKIVIEKFIGAKNRQQSFMRDYKFWCFNGKPFCCLIIEQRDAKKHKKQSNFYDMNFKKMNLQKEKDIEIQIAIKKPKNWETMVELAKKISKNIPVIRVDFYNVAGRIYFGECQKIYSFHCRFKDMSYNEKLSYLLDITKLKKNVDKIKQHQSDRQNNTDKFKNLQKNTSIIDTIISKLVRPRGLEPPHLSA